MCHECWWAIWLRSVWKEEGKAGWRDRRDHKMLDNLQRPIDLCEASGSLFSDKANENRKAIANYKVGPFFWHKANENHHSGCELWICTVVRWWIMESGQKRDSIGCLGFPIGRHDTVVGEQNVKHVALISSYTLLMIGWWREKYREATLRLCQKA